MRAQIFNKGTAVWQAPRVHKSLIHLTCRGGGLKRAILILGLCYMCIACMCRVHNKEPWCLLFPPLPLVRGTMTKTAPGPCLGSMILKVAYKPAGEGVMPVRQSGCRSRSPRRPYDVHHAFPGASQSYPRLLLFIVVDQTTHRTHRDLFDRAAVFSGSIL
jgi:hypothetical protein